MTPGPPDPPRHQFDRVADRYRASAIFSHGEDLQWLVAAAGLTGSEAVLDVGTGTGYTALALAPAAGRVVGVDPAPAMLREAQELAERRHLGHVVFMAAAAEQLPLPDAAFDLVTCRFAAHHFSDANAALREMARVLRPGGRLLVVDNVAPEEPELDRWINELERHRDPSHVQEYTLCEWTERLRAVGLRFTRLREWLLPLEFDDWVWRACTPEPEVHWLRVRLESAPEAARERFRIEREPTLRFALLTALFAGARG